MYKLEQSQILSIASNDNVFIKGKKYYENDRIEDVEYKQEKGVNVVEFKIKGNSRIYVSKLKFEYSGKFISHICNCDSYSMWRGACKHVVCSMLFLLENDNKINNLIERKNISKRMLDLFEKQIYEEIDIALNNNENKKIELTPYFNIENPKNYNLTFTIGTKKQYILKSISEFISNLKNQNTVNYGKELIFKHKLDMFTFEATELISFIEKEYNFYQEVSDSVISRISYALTSKDIGKTLFLNKRSIDDFINLYMDKKVKVCIEENKTIDVYLKTTEFPLKAELINNENIENTINFKFLKIPKNIIIGDKYNYLLVSDTLYKVTKEYYRTISPLISAIIKNKENLLTFVGDDYFRFISIVVPKLIKNNILEESFVPISIKQIFKKLCFDEKDKVVYLKILFCYGEIEINALDNCKKESYRNLVSEYEIIKLVKNLGFIEDKLKKQFEISDEENIYNLYYGGMERLRDYGEILVTDDFLNKRVVNKKEKTKIGIRLVENMLELNVDTSDYTLKELLEAMSSYKLNKKYHRLKDGRFINFLDDTIKETTDFLSKIEISKNNLKGNTITLPKYHSMYIDNIFENSDNISLYKETSYKKLIDDLNTYKDLEFKLPESLESVLRDYQKKGYKFLKILGHYGFGAILADDMGLGKTVQVISLILSEIEEGIKEPTLVVAPTSLIYNWQQEVNKFAPGLKTIVIVGNAETRKEIIEKMDADIYVTTYDTLKRDIENYKDKTFRYIIADEAQNIKNPNTQNARSIKSLKSKTNFALTGTPIENSLTELWSIFDFIMPGYLYSNNKFNKLYVKPIIKENDEEATERLKKYIKPFLLRRSKKEVLKELPDKIETTLFAEMTSEQQKMYAAYLLEARGELNKVIKEEAYNKNQIKILSLLTRLRQICCDPSLFIEDYKGGSGKLDITMETIIDLIESGHRILLFSQFTSMLAILKQKLAKEKIDYFYLDGRISSQQRIDMVDSFNNNNKSIFLISLKAGGTGLNLTGADVVIHYDPWWNPSVMAQATDRAHRFGQDKVVQVFNIVTKNSIEEKILALQNKKRNLIDSVIKDGESFINKMSKEEIVELFNQD